MTWDNPIDEALNDADSILSLLYYHYGSTLSEANKAAVHEALTTLRVAQDALKRGQYSVVKA